MSVFPKEEFVVREEHVKLLKRMYITYNDWTEWGAPEVNPKRPYGNGDLYGDIAEIIGIEPADLADPDEPEFSDQQREEMMKLHKEMETVLQILVCNLGIETGVYEAEKYFGNWTKKAI